MFKLPKLAQQRLEQTLPSESLLHPDADLLAAFVERNLAASERDQVFSHLATCADCREVVALSMPLAGETELTARPSQPAWMQWKFLRYGAGAAMAAVLVGAFLLTRVEKRVEKTQVAQATPATAPEVAKSNAADALTPAAPASNAARAAKSASKETDSLAASSKTASAASAADLVTSANKNDKSARLSRPSLGTTYKDANAGEAGIASSSPARVAKAESGDAASRGLIRDRRSNDQFAAMTPQTSRPAIFARKQQTPEGGVSQQANAGGNLVGGAMNQTAAAPSANQSVAITPASRNLDAAEKRQESKVAESQTSAQSVPAPSKPAMADAISPVDEEARADESALKKKAAVNPLSAKSLPSFDGKPGAMVSTDPVFRASGAKESADSGSSGNAWRVVNGRLQKSVAKHWKDVDPGTAVKLHVVAVSGKDIWVGGDGATLMHSDNNGADWDQVKGDWTGNIVAIRFTSNDRGEIESSNHEKWATADNGATWRKLR